MQVDDVALMNRAVRNVPVDCGRTYPVIRSVSVHHSLSSSAIRSNDEYCSWRRSQAASFSACVGPWMHSSHSYARLAVVEDDRLAHQLARAETARSDVTRTPG